MERRRGRQQGQHQQSGGSRRDRGGQSWQSGATGWGRGAARGRGHRRGNQHHDDDETFRIGRSSEYEGEGTEMSEARVLGHYSVHEDKTITFTDAMLKFIDNTYIPQDGVMQVDLDLNRGADKAKPYSLNHEDNMHNFQRWILRNQGNLIAPRSSSSPRLDFDILCMKNTLTRIMKLPSGNKDVWTIEARCYRGSIYVVSWRDHQQRPSGTNAVNMEVWGHKFLQYVTGGDADDGVRPNEEFRCAVSLGLGRHRILFPANVDCVDPRLYQEGCTDLAAFLMIKSTKEVIQDGHRSYHLYNNQLQQWWAENKLCGIPRLLLGHKTDEGVVDGVRLIKNDHIPHLSQVEWRPDVCINFLSSFLDYLKRKVMEEPEEVHVFRRERYVLRHYIPTEARTDLLPLWYRDQLFGHDSPSH